MKDVPGFPLLHWFSLPETREKCVPNKLGKAVSLTQFLDASWVIVTSPSSPCDLQLPWLILLITALTKHQLSGEHLMC